MLNVRPQRANKGARMAAILETIDFRRVRGNGKRVSHDLMLEPDDEGSDCEYEE